MADFIWADLVNNKSSTITQTMTASSPAAGENLSVASTSGIPATGFALVDSEVIYYDSVVDSTHVRIGTSGRGYNSTTAASHSVSATILFDHVPAKIINDLKTNHPNQILAAKGSLISASAANTPAAVAVGTNGLALIADSSQSSGLKYATPFQDYVSNSDGATVTFNLASGLSHKVTLGGNRTLAVSNAVAGMKFLIKLTQDGTGSRTVTWFSGISWAGGSAPTLTTTASKSDVFGFIATSGSAFEGFIVGQNI